MTLMSRPFLTSKATALRAGIIAILTARASFVVKLILEDLCCKKIPRSPVLLNIEKWNVIGPGSTAQKSPTANVARQLPEHESPHAMYVLFHMWGSIGRCLSFFCNDN